MKTRSEERPTQFCVLLGEGERINVLFNDLNSIVEIDEGFEFDQFCMEIENNPSYIEEHKNELFELAKEGEFNQLDKEAKSTRKRLLEETDNYALTDRAMSEEMSKYRQHLRDITSQPNYPYEIDWGVKPSNEGENVNATMQDLENSLKELGL